METTKSIESIKLFVGHVSNVLSEINYLQSANAKLQKEVDGAPALKEEINRLHRIESSFKRLEAKSPITICPQCDGDGGFSWDTPDGGDGEQCNFCHGDGVVDKSLLVKKEVKEETKVEDNTIADSLPF